MAAGRLNGISTRRIDIADDRHDVAQRLSQQDVDLGVEYESAITKHLRNLMFGARQRESRHLYGTDQRIADGTTFRYSRIQAQIRILEYADSHDIARDQKIFR